MPIASRSTSRFQNTKPILTRDGDPTYGIARKFRFLDADNLNDEDVNTFVVDANTAYRPDRLADLFYNDTELHWILIIFNRVDNPFNWPAVGQVIQYPSLGAVSSEL